MLTGTIPVNLSNLTNMAQLYVDASSCAAFLFLAHRSSHSKQHWRLFGMVLVQVR